VAHFISKSVRFVCVNIEGDMFTRNTPAILRMFNFDYKNYGNSNIRTSIPILFKINPSSKKTFRRAQRESYNTRFNLLNHTGHVIHQQFNIQQLYVLPTLYLCVLYLSENKQRLVPLTA
jgi:hypothetical protein